MKNQRDNVTYSAHANLNHATESTSPTSADEDPGSLRPVLGVLFGLFALIVVTITFASRHVLATSLEPPLGAFTQEQIARAAIATAMDQDPTVIEVVRKENGVIYTTYTRDYFKTTWANRCKLEGDQVIVATATGRWRTDEHNDQITFAAKDKDLVITRRSPDGTLKKRDFSLRELTM
ncbi:hypothetical protein DSLASN_46750 [Desulfoluna limicola]|uniref:Lipocalin-like domain-containing protein n=1 Tax=Desulfoluna limicola TaxID=2810562 RepID=A0ABN6FD35_9BACT|nr:hypothetical protein [Desulfoluna limicola]BCS99043.1 hypothetical protein DSLASN_46750 [Desulfoluna limicola]